MTWLTPIAGAILAGILIPPLVLLYFLKLRRRTQPIACTLLWKRSVEDLHANTPFQKLRRNLLLLLQLLALILLALAIMQPQIEAARRHGNKTILLIDNSASMTATDVEDDANRLEQAKRLAGQRVEQMLSGGLFGGSGNEIMIVAFADHAEVICPFSDSESKLLEAIDRIRLTHGESRIDEALRLARAYSTNVDPDNNRAVAEPAQIELFSDGNIVDLGEQVVRGSERMRYHTIGSEAPNNVAITAVSIDRPYDQTSAVEVFVSLVNFNTQAVICDLQLKVDGRTRAIEEVALGAATIDPATGTLLPKRSNLVFTPFEQQRGAVIEIQNLREDDLGVDNTVRVVVAPLKQLRVALVGTDLDLHRHALQGIDQLEPIELLTPEVYESAVQSADGLNRYDVIVLQGYMPTAEMFPPARYLTFGATPPITGFNDFGESDVQMVLGVKNEHPVFRFLTVDELITGPVRLLAPGDDVEVLADGNETPIIVAVSRGGMHIIHVAFDPLESIWPLQRSFPTFIFNAVEYLGHAGEALNGAGFSPGEALTTRLPQTASEIVIDTPYALREEVHPLDPALLSWGPIREVGIYTLTWREPGRSERRERHFAANLLSEAESRITPQAAIDLGGDTVTGSTAGKTGYVPLWPWAIGLCLTVMMLEWWVYHRKAFI